MTRTAIAVIVVLLACSAEAARQTASPADDSASAPPRLSPQEAIPPAELEAFVDGLVHQAMDAEHIAGASVSVVQSGRIVLEKGYGFADVARSRRVDPHSTMFRIGSITKTFTWIAVMNAIAAGRMSLDDPLNKYLPPQLQVPDEGFAQPIRIRHLMTHSPGFDDLMLGHVFETAASDVRPLAVYLQEERPLRVREPGRVSSYSNYGVALAGAALEQITGRAWQQIVEETIVAPLDMRYTSAREPYPAREELPAPMPAELANNLSKGYRWSGLDHEAQDFEYITHIAPAGAMSTSAGDMARYMLMLLNGGSLDGATVIEAAAVGAFQSSMTTFPPTVGNWNAGFLEARLPGGFRSIGHDGGSMLFFSSMVLAPELNLGVFVTTNTEGGDRLSNVLPARIVERFYAKPQRSSAGAPELAAAAADYDGHYLRTRRPYQGLQGFLFRLLTTPARVTGDGYLTVGLMGPVQRFVPGAAPGEFKAAHPDGFTQSIRIVLEGNRATRIDTPLMAFERVGLLRQPPLLAGAAAVALVAALGTLVRIRARFARRLAQTRSQRLANLMQTAAAASWLVSAAAFGVFGATAINDESTLVYLWPMRSFLVFSIAALAASVLTGGMLVAVPAVWQGRDGAWTRARKVRYTAATLAFAAFAAMLAYWGALQPWNP